MNCQLLVCHEMRLTFCIYGMYVWLYMTSTITITFFCVPDARVHLPKKLLFCNVLHMSNIAPRKRFADLAIVDCDVFRTISWRQSVPTGTPWCNAAAVTRSTVQYIALYETRHTTCWRESVYPFVNAFFLFYWSSMQCPCHIIAVSHFTLEVTFVSIL